MVEEDVEVTIALLLPLKMGSGIRNLLKELLPPDIVELFVPMKAPNDKYQDDVVTWLPCTSSKLSIKSTYEACFVSKEV